MAKKKYYVVWTGRKTGIFETWEECSKQISGFAKSTFKSFNTRELAEQAFKSPSNEFIKKSTTKSKELTTKQRVVVGKPIKKSISVDGAWNNVTGIAEYQGVNTETGEIVFKSGRFEDGTNNIVEFLAIVHALAYCKQNNIQIPIYSDSRNAIGWVRDKNARTNHAKSSKNKKLFDLIDRAIKWLNENTYSNKILKWETKAWGENPADFGRK
ncbi:MAG: ribonuclease H family protein [Cyclobacteriaceae bacterium]